MQTGSKKIEGNRLVVEETLKKNECENSAVYLNSNKIDQLKLFRGDTILVKGKRKKTQ